MNCCDERVEWKRIANHYRTEAERQQRRAEAAEAVIADRKRWQEASHVGCRESGPGIAATPSLKRETLDVATLADLFAEDA